MSKSYIAKFDGKVVGKRTTKDRTYTHAVYVLPSKEWHCRQAHDYVATATDRSNYDYYLACAEGRRQCTSVDQIASSVKVDGGFGAYIERVKARRIKDFEQRDFAGEIVTWCGRLDLATKAARGFASQPWNEKVEIVEAEQVK